MEFDTLAAELAFFTGFGLDVNTVEVEVPLRPGDLVVFDNLALAHGRLGSRRPGELHQRVYGHRLLPPPGQRALRDRFLAAFGERRRDVAIELVQQSTRRRVCREERLKPELRHGHIHGGSEVGERAE
jgi:hypothetical protein